MGSVGSQVVLRATSITALSAVFQSDFLFAIRKASSANEALSLYKTRLLRRRPQDYYSDAHAAVFTVKACARAASHVPHLHAHLLKTALFSHLHTATALLHAYAALSLPAARRLFCEIPRPNAVTTNTMITCYARHGDLAAARSLFDGMPARDIASWSAMIGGYMDSGDLAQGLALFRELTHDWQGKPDARMLVTLLAGCASTGVAQLLGKSIHAYSERTGLEINVQLATSLIYAYAKSGCLMSAFRVFERLPERNVMHWTAMISGLAFHGHGEDAVAFFDEMRRAGIRPNTVTFTSILNACSHAGLIDKGRKYFRIMVEEFGLEPSIHHYGCMVDLLAKEGRLKDAYSLIENMKVEPNIIVWTSFLAACKKHKNFEIAEKAIDKVLSIAFPDDDGGMYTLISDLYAMGGKWNDVDRVRNLMDKHNIEKNRGSSFI